MADRRKIQIPKFLLKRKPDTHKGDYGYVFVLGGSPGLTGAVCLCAQAALRAGAGLVRIGIPKSLNDIFEIKLTEAMSLALEETSGCLCENAFEKIANFIDKIDVMVIGCGAGISTHTKRLFLKIIREIDKPLVIDADGLNALAADLNVLKERKSKNVVLTPHMAEFSRLSQLTIDEIGKKRKKLVKDFAFKYNLTLVLKGNRSLISNGNLLFENKTGNPGMATAGSGDVLSGVIAGLISQGLNCVEAARIGVYLHGLAGDFAAKDKTEICLIASDIIEYLPKAIKKFSVSNT